MTEQPKDRAGFGRVWLNRGIAAAKAGKRAEARQLLFRSLNDESQREMAWLWLASVSDDPRQEQVYLEKVLMLNPDNEFALSGLANLEKRGLKDLPASVLTPDAEGAAGPPAAKSKPAAQAAPTVQQEKYEPVIKAPAPPAAVPAADTATDVSKEEAALLLETETPDEMGAGPGETDLESLVEDDAGRQPGRGAEPTGWTTQTPPVKPVSPSPVPRVYTPAEPAVRTHRVPAERARAVEYGDEVYAEPPRQRRTHRPAPRERASRRPRGRVASMLAEAFDSHEMWAVLASMLSLILLAFVMAFFFAASLFIGK